MTAPCKMRRLLASDATPIDAESVSDARSGRWSCARFEWRWRMHWLWPSRLPRDDAIISVLWMPALQAVVPETLNPRGLTGFTHNQGLADPRIQGLTCELLPGRKWCAARPRGIPGPYYRYCTARDRGISHPGHATFVTARTGNWPQIRSSIISPL